jgi:RNA polymerase-binding transcription factor DksA
MEQDLDRRTHVTRNWLLARSAELRERVRRVDSDLQARGEPLPADSSDAAIAVANDEVLADIRSAALDELRQIETALKRVESGEFAICELCGGEIEAGRLEAAPYATRCADCARQG